MSTESNESELVCMYACTVFICICACICYVLMYVCTVCNIWYVSNVRMSGNE